MKKIVLENIIFNVLKTCFTIVYPVVTFVYVTRIISVAGLGQVSFVKNFASYFCLAASLGITYYGTREGAKVKKDRLAFSKLFWEIVFINIISTLLSFISYFILIYTIPNLSDYKELLFLNSVSIILCGLSCEWVLAAHERFKFIAIRTMAVQIICLLLLFFLVRTNEDVLLYATLLVISGYGVNIFNWIYLMNTKVVSTYPFSQLSFISHLKPILMMFAMLVAIDLYTLLDTTMLGFIKGDYSVGLYTAAIKIPRLTNSMIAAVGVVLVPRLSYYFEEDKKRFYDLVNYAMRFVFLCSLPLSIFVCGMSDEIIEIVCGKDFIGAVPTLRILTPLMLVIPISVLFNNQIFIPMRKEKYVLHSVLLGAFINLMLNSLLIPLYAEQGAAISSVFAEIAVMIVCLYYVKKELKIRGVFKNYANNFVVIVPLVVVMLVFKMIIDDKVSRLVLSVIFSILVFILCRKKEMLNLGVLSLLKKR